MNPGDVVLVPLPQVGSSLTKLRPALILSLLPGPYQSILICGISTQLHHLRKDWDELIEPADADFAGRGLHAASVIRLSYLYAAVPTEIAGVIGSVNPSRLDRLLTHLADHLHP